MRPNILVFCSWLDVDTGAGNFFIEQSELVMEFYNSILVVFKPLKSSIKKLNHNDAFSITEKKSNQGLLVLEVNYPINDKYPKYVNSYFKNKTIDLLYNYLKNKGLVISLIHAHSLFDAGIWAYLYSINYQVSYLITEHNQLTFFNIGQEKCQVAKKTLQNAKKICVVSNDKARQFIANGLYFDFENVGNLIHERFQFLPKQPDSKKRLITIGAHHFLKDQNTIIKALSILDKQLKLTIDFVWIGFNGWGGDYENEIKSLFANANLKNINIVLIPTANREEIVLQLQNSDAFVFSSLSEGMPVSVLEALACGLPVFTSNCGGVDELINDTNGAIYQIKDYNKLAHLLLDFIEGEKQFDNSLISNNVIERFGTEAFKLKITKIYQEDI